jgi:hypothetical protein
LTHRKNSPISGDKDVTVRSAWKLASVLAIITMLATAIYFPVARELEIGPFSPKQPEFLPKSTIWIDAPPLPLTYAHGWWLGCEQLDSSSDRCTLVGHNDRFSGGDGGNHIVYEGTYVSCRTKGSVDIDKVRLKIPDDSLNMWLGGDHPDTMAPAAFLQDGDILVPVTYISECSRLFATLHH